MLPLLTPKLPEVPDRRDGDSSVKRIFDSIEKEAGERRSFRERRATPRVVVMLNLELENDQTASLRVVYRTHDLSTFGLAIRNGPTPSIGSKVSLRLFLADDSTEPLLISGEVLGAFDAEGGARIKFVSPPLPQARRLHRFLK